MDYFAIACKLDSILRLVGLEEFGDDLWMLDRNYDEVLTYTEIIDLSLWALTGAPANEEEK